ncbi:MAG: DUF4838 domain-containing protein [Bacteroidales bacterium]|nr:DUF4838 domain-containing protein [Bacteroidales bacterium]
MRTGIIRLTYLLLLSLVAIGAISCNGGKKFVLEPAARYMVVTGDAPDSLTITAAAELERYFSLITSAPFHKTSHNEKPIRRIYIGRSGISDPAILREIDSLSSDGFLIVPEKERLIIAGKNGHADLGAVYSVLEQFAGCMRFTSEEEYTPQLRKITIPPGHKIHEPAFSFRVAHFPDRTSSTFTSWNRMSTFSDWGLFVHTFQRLMPPQEYFATHPEYFSLVNGRRIRDGQLCLSNPDVIRILTENLGKRIAEEPEKTYWSVSQNDCINYCECEECRKLYQKYGSISGAYVEMANRIAEKFPDKQISTLAYQFTRQAPQNITLAPNVNIMFCSIECNRSMPLATDPRSAGFVKDLSDWSMLTNNIFMWDYVVQFRTYLCPFPNFHTIQPNIQLFRQYGIPMMFQQGSGNSWSDLSELKQYYISKLLWNPDLDGDSLINRFIETYYGAAAPYIRSYFDLSHSAMKETADVQNLDIYGLPSYYFGSFLSRDLVTRYHELMDMAEQSVINDSIFRSRVLRARMSVDYAWLDYALNAGDSVLSFISFTSGGKKANTHMTEALDRFADYSEKTGIKTISEHGYSVKEYRDHVNRLVEMGLRENRARPEDFRSLTTIDPGYAGMGAGSLADGIFGGRTFSSGWLGYQGEDMVIEISLPSAVEVSKFSMNFLCDHVSWVFLPEEVRIEVSADGIKYTTVASGHYPTTGFDQDIIPVSLEFAAEPVKVKKIRITAVSLKKCPDWYRGAGMPSWIFCDEIVVE